MDGAFNMATNQRIKDFDPTTDDKELELEKVDEEDKAFLKLFSKKDDTDYYMDEEFSSVELTTKQKEALPQQMIGKDQGLFDLKKRPRCADGTLNLRFKCNQSFKKDDIVTDYYNPKDPSINVRQELIKMYQLQLLKKQDFDNKQSSSAVVRSTPGKAELMPKHNHYKNA